MDSDVSKRTAVFPQNVETLKMPPVKAQSLYYPKERFSAIDYPDRTGPSHSLCSTHRSTPPSLSLRISISTFKFSISITCNSRLHSCSTPSSSYTAFPSICAAFFRSLVLILNKPFLSPSSDAALNSSETRSFDLMPSQRTVGVLMLAFSWDRVKEPYL